ncbi:hypothetical protein SLEP1_g54480 [Rubroshorea leprosula]|uniref:DUF4219 domain-containing protein n=1 Tax=Rubroshorea leprosula TaxID=152421 RepID=A0AAV5MGJ6_9ROSI|nr:hypothetical protein SLEP1_g54480 [Rubroshorea leprosula]
MKMIELDDDNYERWRICIESYLVSKDLWKAIISSERPSEVDETEWTKRVAAALHAIQISCGKEGFEKIKDTNSAKCAWDKLAQMHENKDDSESHCIDLSEEEEEGEEGEEEEEGDEGEEGEEGEEGHCIDLSEEGEEGHCIDLSEEDEEGEEGEEGEGGGRGGGGGGGGEIVAEEESVSQEDIPAKLKQLEDAIVKGNVDVVRELKNSVIVSEDDTALHLAVHLGQKKIVEELLECILKDQTGKKEVDWCKALSLAALAGETKIAKFLVGMNKNLLTITGRRGHIPLVAACDAGYKEMARYLYRNTPFDLLRPEGGKQGYLFLAISIRNKLYDIALDALHRCPNMMTNGGELAPLRELAGTPSEFFTGSKLRFWQRWIYYCKYHF